MKNILEFDCRGLEFVEFKADVFDSIQEIVRDWLTGNRESGSLQARSLEQSLRILNCTKVNGLIMTRRLVRRSASQIWSGKCDEHSCRTFQVERKQKHKANWKRNKEIVGGIIEHGMARSIIERRSKRGVNCKSLNLSTQTSLSHSLSQVTSVLSLPSSMVFFGFSDSRTRLPQITSIDDLSNSIVSDLLGSKTRFLFPQVTTVEGLPISILEPGLVTVSWALTMSI